MKNKNTQTKLDKEPVGFQSKYENVSELIFSLVGTNQNFRNYRNCMTRLRFEIKDKAKVKEKEIKEIDIVKGINWSGDELQIIIGGEVYKVKESLDKYIQNGFKFEIKNFKNESEKFNFLNFVKGVVLPIIPILMASSILQALYTILGENVLNLFPNINTAEHPLSYYGWFNVMLYIIAYPGTHFIGIFFLYNTVRYFKGNTNMALLIGIIIISPYFFNQDPLPWFTIEMGDVKNVIGIKAYPTSVIPMIGAGVLYVFLDRWVKTWMPASIDIVFRHFITVLVTTATTFLILGNILGLLESVIAVLVGYLKYIPFGISTALFALIWQPLVLTGTHAALWNTLAIPAFNDSSVSVPILFGCVFGVFGQYGAAIGIAIRTKNQNLRAQALGSLPAATFGVTEPIIYGVTLKSGTPFLFGCVASAVGALVYSGIFSGQWYMPNAQGIFSFLSVEPTPIQYLGWALGILTSILAGVIMVIFLFKERPDEIKSIKSLDKFVIKSIAKLETNAEEIASLKTISSQIEDIAANAFKNSKKEESEIIKFIKSNYKLNMKSNRIDNSKNRYAVKAQNAYGKGHLLAMTQYNAKFNELDQSKDLLELEKTVKQLEDKVNLSLKIREEKINELMSKVDLFISKAKKYLDSQTISKLEAKYFNDANSLEIAYEFKDKMVVLKKEKLKNKDKVKK